MVNGVVGAAGLSGTRAEVISRSLARIFPRDAGPSRWARLVGSAVHELGSHLTSIMALARLVVAESESSPRARAQTSTNRESAQPL